MLLKNISSAIKDIDADRAREYFAEHETGSYTLLDVRTPEEYERAHLPGARLIPVSELADRFQEVDPGKPVIAYCASGFRSRAAADLLAGRKFKSVYNLKGGIKSWNGLAAAGPPDAGLFLFDGTETPAELTTLLFGLEEGLRRFYELMAAKTDDEKAREAFGRLAGFEDAHKDRIFGLYLSLADDPLPRDEYERNLKVEFMEGGYRVEDLAAGLSGGLSDTELILEMALGLETQALDLYLRFADQNKNDLIAEIVSQVVDDEKKHLAQLSRLLGKIV